MAASSQDQRSVNLWHWLQSQRDGACGTFHEDRSNKSFLWKDRSCHTLPQIKRHFGVLGTGKCCF